uniref:Uncharacterized protein n=1 Tax=Caenorhabditis japonica TaxID=281687 RepID=A0A8R1E8W2_CAEJA
MLHFDERRNPAATRRPADEEPMWRTGGRGGGSATTKPKKNRKKDAATKAVVAAPKTHRIDVTPEYKSGLYRNVYWMHPNMAITRESRGQEEFVGEFSFYQAFGANVIVNFFTGLDYENAKLRFSHTAHTPPSCRASSKASDDYLRKNIETLTKKLDVLAFKQTIMDSTRPSQQSE